jgi:hypothetical protein
VRPDKLESLDDLLAQAEHYANFSMRNLGRLPPTLFLIGPDGPLMFMPESLGDAAAKDDFATTARLMCIAHAATACVMALEAWAKFATPGEKFDETEPPSEAFDRQEVVVLMGESQSGQKQKLLPIMIIETALRGSMPVLSQAQFLSYGVVDEFASMLGLKDWYEWKPDPGP